MPAVPSAEAPPEAPAPWWKCVAAGLPELFVGLQFLVLAGGGKPLFGAGARELTLLMQVEFLVLHSMAFLGWVALWRPADGKARQTRAVVFWVLFALYCAAALSQGWRYFLLFFGLTFVTYLGLFLSWGSQSAQLQLGARWLGGFLVFILANGLFGTPEDVGAWSGSRSVVRAGALYFLGLAALEISGLYLRAIPRNAPRIREALRKAKTNPE